MILDFVCVACVVLLLILSITLFCYKKYKQWTISNHNKRTSVGFFHPNCNDGGGGERVLWTAVQALSQYYPNLEIAVYTCDLKVSPSETLSRVKERFNIVETTTLRFVFLRGKTWIEPGRYSCFTLLAQSLGSVFLGIKALTYFRPDIFIDTTGYSFTYPIFKYIGRCRVMCYTHYPTITSDMLKIVTSRSATYNNSSYISKSYVLTSIKWVYYLFFSWLYGFSGRCADIVMVNSKWTECHIKEIWKSPEKTYLVYPPCDVEQFCLIPRNSSNLNGGNIKIVSIGQFRPEKNHDLILRVMETLKHMLNQETWKKTILVLIGASRNSEDEERIKVLRDKCRISNLESNVLFRINISYEDLKQELTDATIGFHAMYNEHFGIGVVECMAAGLIVIAHRSGGPKLDLITESVTGFLADNEDEFAEKISDVIHMSSQQRLNIVNMSRVFVGKFSSKEFKKRFLECFNIILNEQK